MAGIPEAFGISPGPIPGGPLPPAPKGTRNYGGGCKRKEINMGVSENEAYQLLAHAIVLQAIRDYRSAVIGHDDNERDRLERWFSTSWCKTLSGLEPETIKRAAWSTAEI